MREILNKINYLIRSQIPVTKKQKLCYWAWMKTRCGGWCLDFCCAVRLKSHGRAITVAMIQLYFECSWIIKKFVPCNGMHSLSSRSNFKQRNLTIWCVKYLRMIYIVYFKRGCVYTYSYIIWFMVACISLCKLL